MRLNTAIQKVVMTVLLLLSLVITFTAHAEGMNSTKNKMFKEPWLSTSKTHQYLGLGALTLGSLTAIAPKPNANDYKGSLHYKLAMGATYLGGAALGTGFVFHYKDLSMKKIFRNPDNLHALFATVGTFGFVVAVNAAPNASHSTPGIIGLAGMATAVKITW